MSKVIPYGLIFLVGGVLAYILHPYEQCSRMYDTPQDVLECVWIKENP